MPAGAAICRPVEALARVVAALARGHAAVDRAAGDYAADRASRSAKQAMAEQAMPNDRARDAADYGAGHRWRAAADFVVIGGASVIMMMAVPRRRVSRRTDGRRSHGRKGARPNDPGKTSHGLTILRFAYKTRYA